MQPTDGEGIAFSSYLPTRSSSVPVRDPGYRRHPPTPEKNGIPSPQNGEVTSASATSGQASATEQSIRARRSSMTSRAPHGAQSLYNSNSSMGGSPTASTSSQPSPRLHHRLQQSKLGTSDQSLLKRFRQLQQFQEEVDKRIIDLAKQTGKANEQIKYLDRYEELYVALIEV
eukprot:gb/GECG01003379.1/.p1 GENE.gb/GECG01003379.1/~~gb/GECG01003379.1/.p1  ORF type:complete len:172 (+),score=22.38 gb/GECG01003379.1/:1-516(+)